MINNKMEKIKAELEETTKYIFTDENEGKLITFVSDVTQHQLQQHNLSLTINELGKKLLLAAQEGDADEIRQLLAKGAPFTSDWLGTSPLHFAAQFNHLEACEIFLRAGMCKDMRTKVERTPLHMAVYEGHIEIVETLLKYGSDADARDMLNMTPLHWAVQMGHAEIAACLIRYGASTTMTNKFDLTPLDIALQIDRTDIVQIINYTIRDPSTATKQLVEINKLAEESNDADAIEPLLQLNLADVHPEVEELMEHRQENDKPSEVLPIETVLLEQDAPDLHLQNNNHNDDDCEVLLGHCGDHNGAEDDEHPFIETVHTGGQDTQDQHSTSFNESLKLLQQHGITMIPDDESNILSSVMETGHSVVLTEAGKQALKSIKVEKFPPTSAAVALQQQQLKKKPAIIRPITTLQKKKKIITVTADQFLALTANNSNSTTLRILNGKLVQVKQPQVKRIVMNKKNKVLPVVPQNNNSIREVEPVSDVQVLLEQLAKAHAVIETYKKRLKKTELELQKYRQKCKLLTEQNILNV